jgi:hypothetical protein
MSDFDAFAQELIRQSGVTLNSFADELENFTAPLYKVSKDNKMNPTALISKYYSVAYKCLLCRKWYTQRGLAEIKNDERNFTDEFKCSNEECVCQYRVVIDEDGNGNLQYNDGITCALAVSNTPDDKVHSAIEEICKKSCI